jgi:hypothetical protein
MERMEGNLETNNAADSKPFQVLVNSVRSSVNEGTGKYHEWPNGMGRRMSRGELPPHFPDPHTEPVFVNLLRSPGINSQPGGPLKQSYLARQAAGGIDSSESITNTNTGSGHPSTLCR